MDDSSFDQQLREAARAMVTTPISRVMLELVDESDIHRRPRSGPVPAFALVAVAVAVGFLGIVRVLNAPDLAQAPPSGLAAQPTREPSQPASGASPSSGPTSAPATPEASHPLALTATAEGDGVRISLELERNPLQAGVPTWITTTVVNTGTGDLEWTHDDCAITVLVSGTMTDAAWRHGDSLDGVANRYKNFALMQLGIYQDGINIDFVSSGYVDRKGIYDCGDIARTDIIRPGKSIVQRARWDGQAARMLGPLPTGTVTLTGTFASYSRASAGADTPSKTLDVHLDVRIQRDGPEGLHAAEAIDAALSDARLIAVLNARDLWVGNEPIVRYDTATDVWQVGLLDGGDHPTVHWVLVDGQTGAIRDWVERPWDFTVDGYP